ncbi:hypothetical protein ISCGN_000931 [Ixodes scapularis]
MQSNILNLFKYENATRAVDRSCPLASPRQEGSRVLTLAEKFTRVASNKFLAINAHLTGSSKPSAMSSCVENRSRVDVADVMLTMPKKQLQLLYRSDSPGSLPFF